MKKRVNKISLKGPTMFSDIGGVSAHIERLSYALQNDGILNRVYSSTPLCDYRKKTVEIIDTSWKWMRYNMFKSLVWLIVYGWRDKSSIFHFHEHPVWDAPVLALLKMTNRRIIYTIHDQMMLENLSKYPVLLRYLFLYALRNPHLHLITVNENIKKQVKSIAPHYKQISIIPAYIGTAKSKNIIEPEIESFVKEHSLILFIYAHHARHLTGEDLYGIDMALKAISIIRAKYPGIGLIVSIPNATVENTKSYLSITEELDITGSVLFHFKPLADTLSVLKLCRILLRPTLTDGDSMIVREALDLGVAVVASDSVCRPDGVILCKSRNIDDFTEKILLAMEIKVNYLSQTGEANYQLIKELYFKVFRNS